MRPGEVVTINPQMGWIKIKCAARYGYIRGWRKVRSIRKSDGSYYVNAAGYHDFLVRPHEVVEFSETKPY